MEPTLLLDPNDKRVRKWLMLGCSFGRWQVLESALPDPKGRDRWLCRCTCGTENTLRGKDLRGGKTVSCGCYRTERIVASHKIHNTQDTKLYNTWNKMVRRCVSKHDSSYKQYGAAGVQVCDRWRYGEEGKSGLDCFAEDMGAPPDPSYSLDRVENSEGYCKENCRWATRKQQNNNRRNGILLTYKGDTHSLAEWSRLRGASYSTMYDRYRRRCPIQRILFDS